MKILYLFVVVFARDSKYVLEKIKELDMIDVPYIIVCGEHINHPKVVYRAPRGKYDAINFAEKLIPKDVDVVTFNDVDARICNFRAMCSHFKDRKVAIVFASEFVREGPQHLFFKILNPIRKLVPVAGSGELMMINRAVLSKILPLKACKAEDTYIMFKTYELGYKVVFCKEVTTETKRTTFAEQEEDYKRRTVAGIYQALSYSKPPLTVRLFYLLLPLMSPLLLIIGKKGYYWTKGILLGLIDFIRGDRTGIWKTNYLD